MIAKEISSMIENNFFMFYYKPNNRKCEKIHFFLTTHVNPNLKIQR